ncbi:MAG: hypothetical protein PHQ42_01655 [Patescibacteria group bacterium]|nr:hypothetical protein [Patescibacteria group bacterium]
MDDFNELGGDENLGQDQNRGQGLGKNQKIAVAVLAVLGVAVIITWMAQLQKNINSPFAYNPGGISETASVCQGPECQESLKTKDTDGDGLSDWDELYIYGTSPYLEDSDSDGLSDWEEIKRGTDPNCPEGRNCSALGSISSGSGEETFLSEFAPDWDLTGEELTADQEKILQDILASQIDAPTLREMLLESGMDKGVLDLVSDEDLMASYEEILESQ